MFDPHRSPDKDGPADEPGPGALIHRVRVFVFGYRDARPDYLLLRRGPDHDSFWTPLQGTLGLGEQLEGAVRREILAEIEGLVPTDLIDLNLAPSFTLGDERVVEWTFACRAAEPKRDLCLQPPWLHHRWLEFAAAFPALELDHDRAAILRLHTLLHEN
jgi:ADP-ribose pyrophosphatase YjhB (NUDIX family)